MAKFQYLKRVTGFMLILFIIYPLFQDNTTMAQAGTSESGIALKNPTHVYSSTDTTSKVLKSYNQGSVLKYKSYNSKWYSAVVVVKGKKQNGFIYKGDVETSVHTQTAYKGIALKSPTHVYPIASTSSKPVKSYADGSILGYKSFTKDWYVAHVYVKGKKKTVYIHKSHVENADTQHQQSFKGIAIKNPTAVYPIASTRSKPVKTYSAGSILSYKTFSKDWYLAYVFINKKKKNVYIHKNHVENLFSSAKNESGRTLKQPTYVYKKAAASSGILTSIAKNQSVIVKQISPSWYEVSVTIKGTKKTGYLYKNDVTTKDVIHVTKYSYDLKKMVNAQMNTNASTDLTNGRGFQKASQNQLEYYTNPTNFPLGTEGYFQFFLLNQSTGISVSEANKKILANTGILTEKGATFIKAAKENHVNELYLISHALLETGRGSSALAQGMEVGKDKSGKLNLVTATNRKSLSDIKKVYNMFGIGAYDDNPNLAGAKKAYQEDWTSPEKAIEGGAKWISEQYINNPLHQQNTLYKMRWNPAQLNHYNQASHQYASDIGWASKQTKTMFKNYQNLSGNYVLVFDVPQFINQASAPKGSTEWKGTVETPASKVTNYPAGVVGLTTTVDLNVREHPNTSKKPISKITKNGTKISILGETTGQSVSGSAKWYKVKANGKTGYVHSQYVQLLNLLEVKANSLNVRSGPGTTYGKTGNSVKNGDLLTSQLNAKNQRVTKKVDDHVWYQLANKTWISGGKNGTEYIKVRR